MTTLLEEIEATQRNLRDLYSVCVQANHITSADYVNNAMQVLHKCHKSELAYNRLCNALAKLGFRVDTKNVFATDDRGVCIGVEQERNLFIGGIPVPVVSKTGEDADPIHEVSVALFRSRYVNKS